jgi:hypothetical protein
MAGKEPPVRDSSEVLSLGSLFKQNSAGRQITWVGFSDEFDKIARRRYFMPDGREVDLDILEPMLDGRSVDTATEAEITASAAKPGLGQRMGIWMRQRLPFLFDEE